MNVVFILALATAISCTSFENQCLESTEVCHSTDYQSYVNCVRKRHKRSTDCENSCDSGNCIDTCNTCDCDSCNYNNCENSCNSCCSSCCSNYIACRTNHCCHKTCQAQCDNTRCRSTCRKNCFETVRKTSEEIFIPQPSGGGSSQSAGQNSSLINNNRHNVTTIIHLNNVINNTNIIDVPININNTNEQNITLYTADTNNTSGSQREQCCTVIGPRQCVSQPTPKCFHYRSKQCGAYCTANIVHKEEKQVCESYYPGAPMNCRQQIYYIPQPTPRCVYQSVWPYVSCGIQRSYVGCEGCYNHYVNQHSNNYLQCSSQCYDEGYQVGPMYRQGPYYRPMYGHAPCNGCQGYSDPYNYGYAQQNAMPMQSNFAPYQQQIYEPSQYFPYQPLMGGYPSNMQGVELIPLNETEIGENTNIVSREVPVYFPEFSPASKDVQIEMNVEPYPRAQAQVKIRKPENIRKEYGDSSTEKNSETYSTLSRYLNATPIVTE